MIKMFEQYINLLALIGVMVIIAMAFALQIALNELPCPLCLLQRVGFTFIMLGLLMNLRFGFRPSHYAIILLSGLYTSFVAIRQVSLHVLPGAGAYGNAIFSLHLYTWAYITSMAIVVVMSFMLGFERQYTARDQLGIKHRQLTNFFIVIGTLLILINLVSVILECGFKACPDNPVTYLLLSK